MKTRHIACFLIVNNLDGRTYVGKTLAYYVKRHDMLARAARYTLHDGTIYFALHANPGSFTWTRIPCTSRELSRLQAQLILEHRANYPTGYNNPPKDYLRALASKNTTKTEKGKLSRRARATRKANHLQVLIESYIAAGEARADAHILAERALRHGA